MSIATILDASAFLLGNLSALLVASAIAIRAVPEKSELPLRIAVGSAAFILVVSLLLLLLGTIGLLDGHLAAGLLTVVAIPSALILKRHVDRDSNQQSALFDPSPLRDWSPLLPVTIGLGAWWLVRNLALGTWITNDDNTYHAAILIQWLRDGEISIVPSTYQAYFPLNGELLALWFLLPFGHDGAVPLAGMVYLTLFLSLSLHFAERLGASPRWRLLPAILVLASTPTLFGLTTFTDLDFSPPVMMLAAIAFLLAALEKADRHSLRHPEIHWPLVLLGGACVGFAVGMKVSFAPPAAVICAIFAFTAIRRSGLKLALTSSALVAVAAIGAGGFWYLRNWALTGNPVYPAALGPFEGPFGNIEQGATKLSTVVAAGLDSDQWKQLLSGFFNRPWIVALVILSGSIAGFALLLRRHFLSANQRLIVLALLACSAVVTLFFPITPFSGTNEVGGLEVTGRYLNFFYLAGGMLAALLLLRLPQLTTVGGRIAALVVTIFAFTLPFALHTAKPVVIAILVITIGGFLALEWITKLPGIHLPRLRYALLLLPLAALATVPLNLRSTDKAAQEKPLVATVESLPDGSKIAQFNRWLYQGYTLAGRRLQHQPIRLLGNGQRYTPMHLRNTAQREDNEDFWTYERHHLEDGLTVAALVRNLRAADIDYLITSPHPEGGWPLQHQLLEDTGAFPKLAESEHNTVWDLRKATANSDSSADPDSKTISNLHTGTVSTAPERKRESTP
jgi:hypothetical protein